MSEESRESVIRFGAAIRPDIRQGSVDQENSLQCLQAEMQRLLSARVKKKL